MRVEELQTTFQISDKELAKFIQDTAAFSWGFQQDVFTYMKHLNTKGYALDFAMRCIVIRQRAQMQRVRIVKTAEELWKKNGLKCPTCGRQMVLEPVNTGPGDQVPGGWRSIWRCVEIVDCGFDELSKQSVGDWIKKLHLQMTGPEHQYLPVEMLPEGFLNPIKGPEFEDDPKSKEPPILNDSER